MTELLRVDDPATSVCAPSLLPLMSRSEIAGLDREELIHQLQNCAARFVPPAVRSRLIHQDRPTLERLAFQVWRSYQPLIHKN